MRPGENDQQGGFVISGHALIRFENVGLRYGVGQEVLRDINFHLLPGSFHFLTGASGAGKTTLLRLLNMSLRPTRGLLYLFGRNIAKNTTGQRADLRRRIGIVFQDFRLLDHLTTWENVALPLRVMGRHQSDYQEDVTELLKWVGLGDRMHAFPAVLSGGEKQRAAIARAVIAKPELLLADEPTGNVDPQMGAPPAAAFHRAEPARHLHYHRNARLSAHDAIPGCPHAARERTP